MSVGVLLWLAVVASSTTLTFYVDHEVEQPLDYVEINTVVKAEGESLEATIEDAANIIHDISTTAVAYCQTYAKSKDECEDIVETSPYSIKTNYDLVKKKPVFAGSHWES